MAESANAITPVMAIAFHLPEWTIDPINTLPINDHAPKRSAMLSNASTLAVPSQIHMLRHKRVQIDGAALDAEVAMAVTRGASSRFARPSKAFCSWSTVGTPRVAAAIIGETEA